MNITSLANIGEININLLVWIVIIVCIFSFIFVISNSNNEITENTLEGYNDQTGRFCITCAGKTFNQCLSCFNCGYCIDKYGNGQCVGGDHRGPYNMEECYNWKSYNKDCKKFTDKLLEQENNNKPFAPYPQPNEIKDSLQYNDGDKYPLLNNPKDYLYYNIEKKSPNPVLNNPKHFLWYHSDPYAYMMQQNAKYGCRDHVIRNYITNI